MNRPNFYSHLPFPAAFRPNFLLPPSTSAQTGLAPAVDRYLEQKPNPLYRELHHQIHNIHKQEAQLTQAISESKNDKTKISTKELTRLHTMIEYAKKVITTIIEQSEKTMQSIASNFR